MPTTSQDHALDTRCADPWAWAVSFVVTLGLHVGIVGFTALSLAAAAYALAATSADISSGIGIVAWLFLALSVFVWARLVKQQVRGFRPHLIRGLGRIRVATTGYDWGEIAADLSATAIGVIQLIPLISYLVTDLPLAEPTRLLTGLLGGLFLALGSASLALRVWLRFHRATSCLLAKWDKSE
jgi:hypothetical protein